MMLQMNMDLELILLVLDGTEAPVLKRVINSDVCVLFSVYCLTVNDSDLLL